MTPGADWATAIFLRSGAPAARAANSAAMLAPISNFRERIAGVRAMLFSLFERPATVEIEASTPPKSDGPKQADARMQVQAIFRCQTAQRTPNQDRPRSGGRGIRLAHGTLLHHLCAAWRALA